MSFRSHKIVQFVIVNRQVLFVIAVLLAPVLILNLMSNASLRAMQRQSENTIQRDYPFLNLSYMKATTEDMANKADKMTPEQYVILRQTNPQLPETLEAYRQQMRARLHQLHKMSEDELAAQLSEKVPPLPRADEAAAGTDLIPSLEQSLGMEPLKSTTTTKK